MRTFLLDTNIISYLADPSSRFNASTANAVKSVPDENLLTILILTFYELAYGYVREPGHSRLLAIIREEGIGVLAPSERGAEIFARLKNAYRLRTGAREAHLVRHNVDFILASTAVAEGAVLVSNDGIFRILAELDPQLEVENWAV